MQCVVNIRLVDILYLLSIPSVAAMSSVSRCYVWRTTWLISRAKTSWNTVHFVLNFSLSSLCRTVAAEECLIRVAWCWWWWLLCLIRRKPLLHECCVLFHTGRVWASSLKYSADVWERMTLTQIYWIFISWIDFVGKLEFQHYLSNEASKRYSSLEYYLSWRQSMEWDTQPGEDSVDGRETGVDISEVPMCQLVLPPEAEN